MSVIAHIIWIVGRLEDFRLMIVRKRRKDKSLSVVVAPSPPPLEKTVVLKFELFLAMSMKGNAQ